jgi:signal transduction histidine kinase
VLERWKQSLATGESFEMEYPVRAASGRFRWFLARAVPLRDSGGKILRWFGTSTDVEEQRRTRNELADALKTRDEFLSIASHELKTPLTSLKLQLQITNRNTKPETGRSPTPLELSQALNVSLRQVDSLTELVEDLLDVARIRTGKFTLTPDGFDLSEMVNGVAAQLAAQLRSAKITLELSLEPGLVGRWDRRRLEQVVINLVSNATKYAPQSVLRISTARTGELARLLVEDTGPGIPKEMLPKIFDRFERAGASRNVGGLGLGLFIVRTIVEAHQGTIQADSELGKGTSFQVELPVSPAYPPEESAETGAGHAR